MTKVRFVGGNRDGDRLRLLDLYCGAGGAGVGYARSGFEVVGVDINPMPRYPYEFHQGHALDFLADHHQEFDVIHASPPCQSSSALTKGTNAEAVARGEFEYIDLIPDTIKMLEDIGKPYIIENVQQAHIRRDLTLCGEMFGLGVIRHRWFQLGHWPAPCPQPKHIKHRGRVAGFRHGVWYEGPYLAVYGRGGGKGNPQQWQKAMDIYWTAKRQELAEAIPPAYTEYIGSQLAKIVTQS